MTEQWFIDRIGKVIYRDAVSCKCSSCTESEDKGFKVRDRNHADYLYMISCDLIIDYRDKKDNN